MQVLLDDKEVIHHGTLAGIRNQNIFFNLGIMKFEIIFVLDTDDTSSRIGTFVPPSNEKMIIYLYNFNLPTGQGNVEPLKLGTYNNRELFFNFQITAFVAGKDPRDLVRTFNYTFFLGDKK